MAFRFSGIVSHLSRSRRFAPTEKLSDFVRSLPPSDKAIAGVLALVFSLSCIAGFIALERTILVEVPAKGGTLREGVVGSPRFVNPLLAFTDADRDLSALTYAGLMGIGPNGLRPVLAESYTISADGKTYTFKLRPEATFSDGTPVTADDVVFTVTKAQDPGLKSPELANWANIRAETIDVHTVQFTLPKAYAPFLEDTTLGILPAGLWKNIPNEQFPFAKMVAEPVGAGPFKVSRIVRDKNNVITEYTLSANKSYALGRPYLDTLVFKFYGNSDDLANAHRRGSIDSAYGIPVPGARTAPYSRVFAVFFNQDLNPAFKELAVRKALSVAIDRDHVVGTILGGYATKLNGPVPPGSNITEPALPEGDPVASARQILTDAGWVYSEETKTWTNAKLALTLGPIILTTSNVPELKALAGSVEKDWEALGIETSLTYEDPGKLVTSVIRPRKYETLFFGMVIGRDQDLFPFWGSSQKQDPGLNIALYGNAEVDRLLDSARQENDQAIRIADLQKISDLIAGDYPAAFTHAPDFVYAVPKKLQGVVLPQITTPADRFATVATWHGRTQWVWPFLTNEDIQ